MLQKVFCNISNPGQWLSYILPGRTSGTYRLIAIQSKRKPERIRLSQDGYYLCDVETEALKDLSILNGKKSVPGFWPVLVDGSLRADGRTQLDIYFKKNRDPRAVRVIVDV